MDFPFCQAFLSFCLQGPTRTRLQPGDLILDVAGVPVQEGGDLQRLMGVDAIDRPLSLRVAQHGRIRTITVTLVEMTG